MGQKNSSVLDCGTSPACAAEAIDFFAELPQLAEEIAAVRVLAEQAIEWGVVCAPSRKAGQEALAQEALAQEALTEHARARGVRLYQERPRSAARSGTIQAAGL